MVSSLGLAVRSSLLLQARQIVVVFSIQAPNEAIVCGDRAVFSKVLKEMVRIERPQATCQALGLCGDLGWPSTHSQISAFALITMLLRRKGAPLSPGRSAAETAEIWVLTLLTASVAWSRVYLGYHDLQVTHCHVPNTSLVT